MQSVLLFGENSVSDVFISYSREDLEKVKQIAAAVLSRAKAMICGGIKTFRPTVPMAM